MKLRPSDLRRIIREEVSKKLDEYESLKVMDPKTLEKAGITMDGRYRKPKPRPLYLDPSEVSDEAKRIASELENSEDFRVLVGHGETTSLVQKVLDLLRRKGIGFGE